jgi:homotetrameric cytidine deaminase
MVTGSPLWPIDSLGAPMTDAERRNIELKAHDRDPQRTLALALALGAEDRGTLAQRDTYFAAARGRLKLREEDPGEAQLIAYVRPDAAQARESRYRIAPVADPAAQRAALDAALGTLVAVAKRRHLLLWEGVRIHLDEVDGLGAFVELEGVAAAGSDLTREHELVGRVRDQLEIDDNAIVADGYADLLAGGPAALLAAADAAMRRAYAPYSRFRVGAALRAPDGSIVTGVNVENASYPQGQCAETSALGALVAAGQTRITEVAVTAAHMEFCPPCGGCRQRLAEFAAPDTPVHLGKPGGRRMTTTVGELLPLAFEFEPKA